MNDNYLAHNWQLWVLKKEFTAKEISEYTREELFEKRFGFPRFSEESISKFFVNTLPRDFWSSENFKENYINYLKVRNIPVTRLILGLSFRKVLPSKQSRHSEIVDIVSEYYGLPPFVLRHKAKGEWSDAEVIEGVNFYLDVTGHSIHELKYSELSKTYLHTALRQCGIEKLKNLYIINK